VTRGLVLSLLSAAIITAVARPMPAAAFESDGCTLQLTALDAAGDSVGSALSGADDATQLRPLVVPSDGSLRWQGGEGGRISVEAADGPVSWRTEAFGVPTPVRGSDVHVATSGSIAISHLLPFQITGLFQVSGEWAVADATCHGSGWLRISGDPVSSVPFPVALAMLLLGAVLLAVGGRGRWRLSIVGGALIGAGSLVLMVIYAALPFGARTPAAVMLLGILLGLLVGLAASRPGRRLEVPAAGR
jgi:hypothetical protein